MRDEIACAFEKFEIFLAKCIHFLALGIEDSDNMPVPIHHRHDDFRSRRVKRRQIPWIFTHISDDNRLSRLKRRAAQPLGDRKSRIGWRFLVAGGHDDEFFLRHFVNADPAIVPRRPNHLRDLFHALGACAGEHEPTQFLQSFTVASFIAGLLISAEILSTPPLISNAVIIGLGLGYDDIRHTAVSAD